MGYNLHWQVKGALISAKRSLTQPIDTMQSLTATLLKCWWGPMQHIEWWWGQCP